MFFPSLASSPQEEKFEEGDQALQIVPTYHQSDRRKTTMLTNNYVDADRLWKRKMENGKDDSTQILSHSHSST